MPEVVIARIKSTSLGVENHGIMSSYLHLEGDHWGQGFGGLSLDEYDPVAKRRKPHLAMGLWIAGCLRVADASDWNDLPGKFVRAERDGGLIKRIRHILKDDVVFDPLSEMRDLNA